MKKRIKKRKKIKKEYLIGILIIAFIVTSFNTIHIDNAIKCNNVKGEYCTNYEIERYVRGDYEGKRNS